MSTEETKMPELSPMDKVPEAVVVASEKIEKLALLEHPDTWNSVLATARIEAASDFIPGVMVLIFMVAVWKAAKPWFVKQELLETGEAGRRTDWGDMMWFGGSFLCPVLMVGLFITFVIQLCDLWPWVGLFEPKYYFGAKLLGYE